MKSCRGQRSIYDGNQTPNVPSPSPPLPLPSPPSLVCLFFFYSIKIAGQDVKEVSQASLRRAVGVVPQDTVLFNDTIGYNIAYGDLTACEDEIKESARKAQLDASIDNMPEVSVGRY